MRVHCDVDVNDVLQIQAMEVVVFMREHCDVDVNDVLQVQAMEVVDQVVVHLSVQTSPSRVIFHHNRQVLNFILQRGQPVAATRPL